MGAGKKETRMRLKALGSLFVVFCMTAIGLVAQAKATTAAATQAGPMTVAEVAKIMPATVFFRGQSAPVQARNSGGVRFADKGVMLVALVDTSGYSTSVQEKYQAYLITESPLEIGGQRLPAGVYGCGFIAGDNFIMQDVGAHDLFTVHSVRDAELRRPTPLQVMTTPGGSGEYRLYAGRNYVAFRLATP